MTAAAGTAAVLAAGDTVTSGALPLAVALAALAGLVSFASPCVLPLVPGYLGYVTGLTGETLAEHLSVTPDLDAIERDGAGVTEVVVGERYPVRLTVTKR